MEKEERQISQATVAYLLKHLNRSLKGLCSADRPMGENRAIQECVNLIDAVNLDLVSP